MDIQTKQLATKLKLETIVSTLSLKENRLSPQFASFTAIF